MIRSVATLSIVTCRIFLHNSFNFGGGVGGVYCVKTARAICIKQIDTTFSTFCPSHFSTDTHIYVSILFFILQRLFAGSSASLPKKRINERAPLSCIALKERPFWSGLLKSYCNNDQHTSVYNYPKWKSITHLVQLLLSYGCLLFHSADFTIAIIVLTCNNTLFPKTAEPMTARTITNHGTRFMIKGNKLRGARPLTCCCRLRLRTLGWRAIVAPRKSKSPRSVSFRDQPAKRQRWPVHPSLNGQ